MIMNVEVSNKECSSNKLVLNGQGQLILLIESDFRLAQSFQQHLHTSGYNVMSQSRHDSIQTTLQNSPPDMVILDIGFSDLTALSTIADIRRYFVGPLVVLTSRDSEQEQITAFEYGVDEYMVKPLSSKIFSVRIASLFKRCAPKPLSKKAEITVGELTLSPMSFKCALGKESIALTQFEFKLLHLLAENVGVIMSRDIIYRNLLGREYNGSERTVDVRVSQLREKLALVKAQKAPNIETIWGQGYLLSEA